MLWVDRMGCPVSTTLKGLLPFLLKLETCRADETGLTPLKDFFILFLLCSGNLVDILLWTACGKCVITFNNGNL